MANSGSAFTANKWEWRKLIIPFMEDTKPTIMRLYSDKGERLYLNKSERLRFSKNADKQTVDRKLFCLCLFYTGCRLSEARYLTFKDIQCQEGVIAIRSLKKRKQSHIREVPVPKLYLKALSGLNKSRQPDTCFWPISRSTAWRWVKEVMQQAGIEGKQATAKGLRHSFGVWAAINNIPIGLIQRWMGHSKIETTLIYSNIIGKEERLLAGRMWQ